MRSHICFYRTYLCFYCFTLLRCLRFVFLIYLFAYYTITCLIAIILYSALFCYSGCFMLTCIDHLCFITLSYLVHRYYFFVFTFVAGLLPTIILTALVELCPCYFICARQSILFEFWGTYRFLCWWHFVMVYKLRVSGTLRAWSVCLFVWSSMSGSLLTIIIWFETSDSDIFFITYGFYYYL